ncbi:hypothetical protein [Streptosporangium roseum]|uniref:hypothetical protein n=1 Tax=Streptosporangium roseum TaxID=2001 RepID=UPI0033235DE8
MRLLRRLRERGSLLARQHRQLAESGQVIRELEEYVAEMRRDLETAHTHAAKLEARLRAVDGDRLATENAELHAEVAVLRARRASVSREEYLREKETNARLRARLEAMEAGRVAM